ncbi:MAG: SGNH/GDSL hydrolase family protein [Isosphaeraceae bacterium]
MRPCLRKLQRVLLWLQTGWSILGVTILLVLLVELALQCAFGLKDLGKPRIPPDPRVIRRIPDGASWLDVHYRELERLNDRWQPYVYFRQTPFSGQTIRIDSAGRRKVWEPTEPTDQAEARRHPLKILMLGGSSLWGFGARDDATIPSLLARGLHDRRMRTQVRNLSEIGYVNTQELVALVRELQAGYRPDLVLFYDGVNDTASALLEGRATVTTNETNRAREFNLLQSPARLTAALAGCLIKNSASFRLAEAVGKRFGLTSGKSPVARSANDLDRLAGELVRGYAANVKMVEALGKAYGFRAVFVWQPVIFTKSQLVPFEQEERRKYAWASDLFNRVHAAIGKSPELVSDPLFLDLSDIFQTTDSLVFLDFCHTTEQANATIASELIRRMIKLGVVSPPAQTAERGTGRQTEVER